MPSGQVLDYDRAPIVTTPVKFAKFILKWIMVIGYIPPSSDQSIRQKWPTVQAELYFSW